MDKITELIAGAVLNKPKDEKITINDTVYEIVYHRKLQKTYYTAELKNDWGKTITEFESKGSLELDTIYIEGYILGNKDGKTEAYSDPHFISGSY